MIKKAILIICSVLLCLLISGCSNTEYKIIFVTDGGSEVANQIVTKNELAIKPEDPTKEGYIFETWIDEDNKPFDFKHKITSDITLTAKWKTIDDEDENNSTTTKTTTTKASSGKGNTTKTTKKLETTTTKVKTEPTSTTTTTTKTITTSTTTTKPTSPSNPNPIIVYYYASITYINGDKYTPTRQLIIKNSYGTDVTSSFKYIRKNSSNGEIILTKTNSMFVGNVDVLETYLGMTLYAEKNNGEKVKLY